MTALTEINPDWATGWSVAGTAAPTFTTITWEQFLAENPEAKDRAPANPPATVAKLVQPTPSATSSFFRTTSGSLNLDLSTSRNIGFRWYIPKQLIQSHADNGFFLKIITSGGAAEAFTRSRLLGNLSQAENAHGYGAWIDDFNDRNWLRNQFGSDIGTVNTADVDRLEFTIRSSSNASAAHPAVMYLFEVFKDAVEPKPKIILSADDGTITHYSVMYQSAKSSADNIPISLCIIPELVDSGASYLTTAQIDEMYADNFDVIRHSDDPVGKLGLALDTDIANYFNNVSTPFHENYRKNNGDKVWVWGGGEYKRTSPDPLAPETFYPLMSELGIRQGRRTGDTFNNYSVLGQPERWNFVSMSLGLGGNQIENFTQFQTYIDKMIAMGTSSGIHTHEFISPPSASTHFPVEDWPLCTAYLRTKANAGEIEIYSLAQYLNARGTLVGINKVVSDSPIRYAPI